MRAEKKRMVEDIGRALTESKYVFFVSYKGMKVSDFSELRADLAKNATKCRIFKNRLIKKAAELNGLKLIAELNLKGDTAVICGTGDVAAVAKGLLEFGKAKKNLEPKFGYVEGSILNAKDIQDISTLPPKNVLQAQLLGMLQAPSRNLVSVLYAKLSQIVNVLNNYKEKKEKMQA